MFVVNVWFCCSSWLSLLILAYLKNLMHPFFLLHRVICFGGYLFVHKPNFFEKYMNFCCFFICSSFGRQLCQNCGWAGSEPFVQSHITEPPCLIYEQTFLVKFTNFIVYKLVYKFDTNFIAYVCIFSTDIVKYPHLSKSLSQETLLSMLLNYCSYSH